MYQLIGRPAVYLVVGIGVLALLVSQLRNTDHDRSTSVSELDPFSSLNDLSGPNLATSNPNWQTTIVETNVNPIEVVRNEITGDEFANQEMVRDEITSTNAYQQTAAARLNNDSIEIQPVEVTADETTADSAIQLNDLETVEGEVSQVNEIDPVDNSLTMLELEKPILLDGDGVKERYQLEESSEVTFQAEPLKDDSVALVVEQETQPQTTSAFENAKASELEEDSLRPKGWRKNPFIVDTEPASNALEIETSSNESLPKLNGFDASSGDSSFSADLSDRGQVSTAGNFQSENAPSVVSNIPFSDQPMQSVMAQESQISSHETHNESLPIVVGLPNSVAHKAVHNIEYGKSLSRRGAAFAARQEYYSSLRILAQAHDTQAGGTSYTQALRDAIIALKEAEDFIVSDTETQIGLNVGSVIDGHATKLISMDEAPSMTAIGAMQRYFAFASNQLRVASGQNPVSAEALYCLGKLHTVQAKFGANSSKLDIAKAIVFHQAAIAADETNFRSANELGVLLANSGRLNESQKMLKRSLQIQQLPEAWQNLAVVHQRSGEDQLAQLAQREFMISSRQEAVNTGRNTIRWMKPDQFNLGTPLELRQGAAQPNQANFPIPKQDMSKPTISQRLRSLF